MSKKTQATIVLILMVVGFIGTYNIDTTWGMIINHGFLAAIIGGLADWFAVTALFRKPLGFITYRSEILPRNRERIMREIVNFIGKDLLNPQYIIDNLQKYNMADMIVDYADKFGGREKLKFAMRELINEVINSLDTKKIGHSLAVALKGRRENFNMARIIIRFLLDFIKTPSGDKFLDSLIKVVRKLAPDLLKTPFFHKLIETNVQIIKKRYTGDKQSREIMFGMIDLSSEKLTQKLISFINNYSEKLLDYDSSERKMFKEFLTDKIEILGRRDGYKQKVAQLEHYFFVKKFDFSDNLVDLINSFCYSESNKQDLFHKIDDIIDEYLTELAKNKETQLKVNTWISGKISDFIQNNSQWSLNYMYGELMKYSEKEFVGLVEGHVGNDLQMIRINGSVVGAFAGVGLYIITLIAERVFS